MKQTYRALTCFLIDFWSHTECEPHTNPATVQELQVICTGRGGGGGPSYTHGEGAGGQPSAVSICLCLFAAATESDTSLVCPPPSVQTLPVEKGQSKCFHLQGPQGGRVCFVHVVLGTSLTANREVGA